MPRYFSLITPAQLKVKVDEMIEQGNVYYQLKKDLKVEFDFENFGYRESDFGPKGLMGYHTWTNGLTFCGMCAGGDWEHPVFFIVYWDGKKLRGYVPTDGNPWNTTTKQAYGNDEEADLKNVTKRWPAIFSNLSEVEPADFEFEPELIKQDILSRLAPPDVKPSLQQRVESLTFYGIGDEAYELFQQACEFAYKLNGLGFDREAETVVKWAESMAKDSQEYWDGTEGDKAQGYWG